MDSMKTKQTVINVLIQVIMIIVSITMLVPFLWMVLTAFKTVTEATSVNPLLSSRKSGEQTHSKKLSET